MTIHDRIGVLLRRQATVSNVVRVRSREAERSDDDVLVERLEVVADRLEATVAAMERAIA